MDIPEWLTQLGLEQYASAFAENEVNEDILPDLTSEDLKELGVQKIGHRRKILSAIAKSNSQEIDSIESKHLSVSLNQPKDRVPDQAERRQLTVMFVDLVGSTELAIRFDPEDMRDLITTYQDTVAGIVSRFEGFVAKFMGDGVLCYFGWPRANEDDAERSVRAALAIVERVRKISMPDGQYAASRIGIATGVVIVGDLIGSGATQEAAVVGETPNLAARLQGVASHNEVVLSASTKSLLGFVFDLQSLGPQSLKGIANNVEAFVVAGEKASTSRFEARRSQELTPIVGRSQELDLIAHCWSQTCAGHGKMVLVIGEAGIGKSRVVQAAIDAVSEDNHTKLTFQCSPYHADSAFYPLLQQINRGANIESTDDNTVRFAKLEAMEGITPQNMALFATLMDIDPGSQYPLPDLTPAQLRARTMQSLVALVRDMSSKKPLLIIFEDLHWVDPTTLEFLELLLEDVEAGQILLLATARPTFEHKFGGHPVLNRLVLNRLGQDQIELMIGKLSGGKTVPFEVTELIAQRTDGVPLFVEELTKTILESGVLRNEGTALVLDGPLDAMAIPATLHDSLMARLDRMSHVKEVAQMAACIGRDFSHHLMVQVSSLIEVELEQALDKLIEAELIYRRGKPPEATYLFKHALVRDAAYESLLRDRKRKIHATILEALEANPETASELLAVHAENAGLSDRAIDLWAKAGTVAIARPALDEAIAHLLRAIALLKPDVDREDKIALGRCLPLQAQLAVVYMSRLGWAGDATKKALEAALVLDDTLGQTPARFSILYGLMVSRYARGDHLEAVRHGQPFVDLAEAANDTAPAVVANRSYAAALLLTGELEQAQTYFDRAVELFNPELHRNLANKYGQDLGVATYGLSSCNLFWRGKTQAGDAWLEKCLSYSEACDSIVSKCYAHLMGEFRGLFTGELELHALHAERMAELSNEHDINVFQHFSGLGTAIVMLARGDTAGIEIFKRYESNALASRSRILLPYYQYHAARQLHEQGLYREATEFAYRSRSVMDDTGENFPRSELHRLFARMALREGDSQTAETHLNKALDIARAQGATLFELRAANDQAALWRKTGEDQSVAVLLNPILNSIDDGDCTEEVAQATRFVEA